MARAFELESSKMATKTVDLAPYFDLTKPGRYTITATAAIPEWNVRVKSPPKSFNVVPGLRVWEKLFGVPPVPGAEPGQPEVRKYALLKVNYRDSMKLYLRLTDAPNRGCSRCIRLVRWCPSAGWNRSSTNSAICT